MKTFVKVIIAILSASMVSGCLTPAAKTTNEQKVTLSRCEQMATIDDFEDANTQITTREGRGEYLYTYADGLGTNIEFPDGDFRAYPGGVAGSKYTARLRGTTATSGGDIYAGLGFGLNAEGAAVPYDASKYSGVSFLARRGSDDAVNTVRLNVPDVNTDEKGNICSECFNHFGTTIKLTDQWVKYVIYFDEMEQRAGWGNPRPEHVDPSAILGMAFQFTVPGIKFDVMVDDIRFVGACGEDFAGDKKEDAKPEPAPAHEEPEATAPEEPEATAAPAPAPATEEPEAAAAPAAEATETE